MRHQTVGTRAQVFHGTAKHTSGGLEKHDLMQNKSGRIVSRRKHNTAKREMRLVKHGFGTKKGKFGFVKMGKKSKRHLKGGAAFDNAASFDYAMSATSGSSGAFIDSVSATSVNNSSLTGGRRGRRGRGRRGRGRGRSSRRHRGGSPLMPAAL
jgi:hypothetical protein